MLALFEWVAGIRIVTCKNVDIKVQKKRLEDVYGTDRKYKYSDFGYCD